MPFTDASWRVSGLGDETLARNTMIPIGPPASLNLWLLPVAPRVTIAAAGSTLAAKLLPEGPFSWMVLSGTFPVGPTPKIVFEYTSASVQPDTAAGLFGVPGLFTRLQEPLAASGPLVISSFDSGAGVFDLQPVPGLAAAGAWS